MHEVWRVGSDSDVASCVVELRNLGELSLLGFSGFFEKLFQPLYTTLNLKVYTHFYPNRGLGAAKWDGKIS